MSNMSKDIQYSSSDTRPPMLDRIDFKSWQQRIRMYCLGKDNGENIMKSITKGPFQMGMVVETLAEGTEGALHLGPERVRVFTDLTVEEKERYKANIRATNILLQGSELTKDDRESHLYDEFEHFCQIKGETIHVYYVSRFITEVKLNRGLKESNFDQLYAYLKQHEVHANENKIMMERFIQPNNDPLAQYPTQSSKSHQLSSKEPSPADHFQLDSGSPSTENLIESLLTINLELRLMQGTKLWFKTGKLWFKMSDKGHIAREYVQGQSDSSSNTSRTVCTNASPESGATMFMANLTSEDPIYDEVGPSYDSNNPFEVQDHDTFVDHMDEYHEVHEMQNDVQHNYVVDSDADYTSDSNIIPYDQYVEDNEEHVVQSNVSSVRNDALMSILDEMHEQGVQSRLANKPDMVVNDSVTSELARYKELVGEYEKRAKFELTDRERKIDEQMRIIISDRNRKETSLKSELHSAQILLSSTVDHYKSKTEEVTFLKKDFKQKEDKFLEEFLDIKKLKDKIEDRLYKQDQSVQTVHSSQSVLYSGHALVTTNHAPTVIHDSEDTREIAEITRKKNVLKYKALYIFWSIDDNNRKKAETSVPKPISALTVYPPNTPFYDEKKKVRTNHAPAVVHESGDTLKIAKITRKRMLKKVKSPLCVKNKLKFAPPDYSKENYLATFTPQRNLTVK
ncbi:hypothetical protein Tco_0382059 [Tanacetum coccineum]